jgi:hypothetical protein
MRSGCGRVSRVVGVWLALALMVGAGSACAQTQQPPAQFPPPAPAGQSQAPAGQSQPPAFQPEEIEALVAPIALYPDSLLSQVLMASTYPLEIVHAARWVKANPKVKGDAAIKAVESQTWDVSVKSLVAFPQVLEPMSDKLEWTQKLGDAFLAQEKDVLAAVQRLRSRAEQSGNLKSNEQQKVIVEPAPAPPPGQPAPAQQTIVRIEPAQADVIYVPAYNPTVVYAGWSYPTYPPYYWPPYPAYYPGGALVSGFAWGVGFAAAGAMFGNCNWGGGDVDIDVNKATNIDRSFNRTNVEGGGKWKHDGSHRQGVAYRDNATREKFGKDVPGADRRNDYRGRDGAGDRGGPGDRGGAGNRAGVSDRGGAGDRGGVSDRGSAGDRGGAGNRAGVSDRGNFSSGAGGGRDNAFKGAGQGGGQRDFNRGQASAGGRSFSGGGGRGGGGRGGGGRR